MWREGSRINKETPADLLGKSKVTGMKMEF